jgi:hypothetical protein
VADTSGTFYGQAMTAGHIYTIAGNGTSGDAGDGGLATSAELSFPTGAGVDAHGNVLIADGSNNQIRAVAASTGTFYGQAMTAGHIYTIAGNGTSGYSGDGGPATAAALDIRAAPTVDSVGNVVFADVFNSVVRVVAAASGTFYGVAMKAGDIYTVAGTGNFGLSGNGGPRPPRPWNRRRPPPRTAPGISSSPTSTRTGSGSCPAARARSTARR